MESRPPQFSILEKNIRGWREHWTNPTHFSHRKDHLQPQRPVSTNFFGLFTRSWRISTTLNTTKKFLIIFKLIQQAIMVILSCLAKKNQNLNSWKKSSVYYWKLRFQGRNTCKLPFLVINWTFFPSNSNFDFSSRDNSEWP